MLLASSASQKEGSLDFLTFLSLLCGFAPVIQKAPRAGAFGEEEKHRRNAQRFADYCLEAGHHLVTFLVSTHYLRVDRASAAHSDLLTPAGSPTLIFAQVKHKSIKALHR